jgi:hypothetical protein
MRFLVGLIIVLYIGNQLIKCLMEEVRHALRFRKRGR